jgi:hypothetical protein
MSVLTDPDLEGQFGTDSDGLWHDGRGRFACLVGVCRPRHGMQYAYHPEGHLHHSLSLTLSRGELELRWNFLPKRLQDELVKAAGGSDFLAGWAARQRLAVRTKGVLAAMEPVS